MKEKRHAPDRDLINLMVCIGEGLLGTLLLLNPLGFTSAAFFALGLLLVLLGATRLAGYFRAEAAVAARSGGLVIGLLLLLAGGFCIFRWEWFVLTFPILTVVYGILTLANGLNKLQCAVDRYRLGHRRWYLAMIGAGLTLLFGILLLADPFGSTTVLWTFLAVSLLAEAALDLLTLVLGRQ